MCWRGKTVSFLLSSSTTTTDEVSGKLESEKPLDKFETFLHWLHTTFHPQTLSSWKQTTKRQHRKLSNPFLLMQPNQFTQSNIICDGLNVCNRTTRALVVVRQTFSSTFNVNICSVCRFCQKSDSVFTIIVEI